MEWSVRERVAGTKAGFDDFMEDARRIMPYFDPYRRKWIFLFLIANAYTLLSLVDPLLMKFVIDEVLIAGDLFLLHASMVFFIVISVLSIVLGYYSTVLYERISQNILFDIRTEVYNHLQRMDIQFFENHYTGDLMSRLNTDISSIDSFLSLIYDDLLINLLKVLVIFTIITVFSVEFSLITLFIIPLMVMVQKHYGRILRTKYRTIREASADLLSFFQERLTTMQLIKVFNREEREKSRQEQKGNRLIRLNVSYASSQQVATAITGFITFSIMLFVLWFGGYQVVTGQLTIGSLIAIYTYIGMLFGPVRTLTDLNVSMQTTIASAERIFEILDAAPRIKEKEDAYDLPPIDGDIDFENVTFSYSDTAVLEDITLHIDANETIGIVGHTGAGKTTLARLLLRLVDPEKGRITIDGHDIRDVTLSSLRSQIGLVEQDLLFFHTTLKENLRYAKPDATHEEIVQATKRAGLHEFISNLPDGYDTDIGERGEHLSRGERQRLALSRVFLNDPPIVIFDEATSSLDPQSEAHVERSIRTLSKDKTMFVIAHRLSTMQYVDRLIVVDEHGIVERGTFEELCETKGEFYDIFQNEIEEMVEH